MAKFTVYDTHTNKNILIHPTDSAENVPGLFMDSGAAVLYSPEGTSSIMVSAEDGVSIMGPLAIQTTPEQIRIAGLWKVNPMIMTSLPSTLYTPIPWMRQSFPKPPKSMIEGIVSISSLLAGLS